MSSVLTIIASSVTEDAEDEAKDSKDSKDSNVRLFVNSSNQFRLGDWTPSERLTWRRCQRRALSARW